MTNHAKLFQVPRKFRAIYSLMLINAEEKLKDPVYRKAIKKADQRNVIKLLEEIEERERHPGPYY